METLISRADGREDGEDWTENYEELPGGAGISIILESTTKEGVGPRLHQHPYATRTSAPSPSGWSDGRGLRGRRRGGPGPVAPLEQRRQ